MKRIYHAFCWSWLLLSWFYPKISAEKRTYVSYDMTSICKSHQDRFKISMHHSGTGSTGILYASDYLEEAHEHQCMAVIRPPDGYGVVFNIEDVKLRKDQNYDCRDYIKIFNETSDSKDAAPVCRECCRSKRTVPICGGMCGYEEDGEICEEYCGQDNNTVHMGTGRSIAVLFHTRCGSCSSEKEQIGFRIVFTAYRILVGSEACDWPLSFQCDNGRCIWGGLTCDGHNNCGDMSDESRNGRSQCGYFPSPAKVVIVISAVFVTVLVGVLIAYLPRLTLATLCQKRKVNLKLHGRRNDITSRLPNKHRQSHKFNAGKDSREERLPDIHEASLNESEV